MSKGFFKGIIDGMDEKLNRSPEEVLLDQMGYLLGSEEKILHVHTFFNDKMIITNKKLIYMDKKIAKNTTYAMIPFNKVTSYALLVPTGISLKSKLQIFTGGDKPSMVIESMFDEGMQEFCKILADNI